MKLEKEKTVTVKSRVIENNKHVSVVKLLTKQDIIAASFQRDPTLKKIVRLIDERIERLLSSNKTFTKTEFDNEIKKLFSQNRKGTSYVEYWLIRGYDETEALEKLKSQQQNAHSGKLKKYIEMGYDEESAKLAMYADQKIKNPSCIEYWLHKGFSDQESKDKVVEYGRNNSVRCVEYWLNKGDTEEESRKKVAEIQNNAEFIDFEKRILPSNVEYWTNRGFSRDESILKVSERQSTFTLEKCIEKYGECLGRKRWQDRQDKWQNTLINKPDYEEIKIKRVSCFKHRKASKQSLLLFIPLYKWLRKKGYTRSDMRLGITGSSEFLLNENGKIRLYDFTIISLNAIIEFHGTAWHPKSEEDDNWKSIVSEMTAKEKWDRDREKIQIAENNGFIVKEIWSDEEDKLNKCKSFIINLEKIHGITR